MKYLLILIISIFCIPCQAQPAHVPDKRAKLINDKAVNTYTRYYRNHDSVISAIHTLGQALVIDSNYFNAWANKLGFESQIGEYESALNTAKRMIRIFPGMPDVIFYSGLLALKTGHNDEATATLNRLVKIYDAIPDTNNNSYHLKIAQLNKGIVLKLLGRPVESKKILMALSNKERDPVVKRHIIAYITGSKEEIINKLLNEYSIAQ